MGMVHHCKSCDSMDARMEHLLDGRPIALCGVCRSYLQGLIRTCHNCDYEVICIWRAANAKRNSRACDDWHRRAGTSK